MINIVVATYTAAGSSRDEGVKELSCVPQVWRLCVKWITQNYHDTPACGGHD